MQQDVSMTTTVTSVIVIMPAACLLHYLLCTMQQNDLYCPVMKATATASVVHFNFNNSKYSVQNLYIHNSCSLHAVCMCNFHSVESIITEHVIDVATTTTT